MQLKHYEIVTDADKLKVDIQKVCMEHKTIKQWAYILHDKDDTRPHYHIYVNFGKAGVDHCPWRCISGDTCLELTKFEERNENETEKKTERNGLITDISLR